MKKYYVRRTVVEQWWIECKDKKEALEIVSENNDPTKSYIKSIIIKPIKS